MSLDERKRLILQAIVEDYINTAEPVGSRSIAKRPELNLSAATIRNEMGDLEEMGLLTQPHTSAGRIPSNLGYRFYVNSLMKRYQMTKSEIEVMKNAMLLKVSELDKIVKDVSAAFSRVANLPTVGILPGIGDGVIKSIKLVRLDESGVMIIISVGDGIIKNKILRLDKKISEDETEKLNNILGEKLAGMSLSSISLKNVFEMENAFGEESEILNGVLSLIKEAASESDGIIMEGATNILSFPEYSTVEKIKEIFDLFDDKPHLGEVIKLNAPSSDIKVIIGDENSLPELKNNSLIISPYKINDELTGFIGVIGPVRMDYSKIVSSLEYFSKNLEKTLKERKRLREGDEHK